LYTKDERSIKFSFYARGKRSCSQWKNNIFSLENTNSIHNNSSNQFFAYLRTEIKNQCPFTETERTENSSSNKKTQAEKQRKCDQLRLLEFKPEFIKMMCRFTNCIKQKHI
jgi:hypothetical protein